MQEHRGHVLVGLFGVVFALAALAFGFFFVREPAQTWWSARSWQTVPATLHATSGRGFPGGSLQGLEYRYESGGRKYSSRRVGFYDNYSGTSYDDYHRFMHERMREIYERNDPLVVWVNPRDPSQSVIDRNVNVKGMLMPLAVSGAMALAGLFFAWIGFASRAGTAPSPAARRQALRTKRPLAGSSRSFPKAAWVIAIFWNAIVGVMLASGLTPSAGVPVVVVWLVAGVFVAIGLGIAWYALTATLRYRRYRDVALDLDPYPATVGGGVAGRVTVPIAFDPHHRFKVVLSAARMDTGGNLSNDTTRRTMFHQETVATAAPAGEGTALRFRFSVPPEAPTSEGFGEPIQWTTDTADRVFLQWTVKLAADVPGVDLDEEFEIPVVRAEGAPAAAQDASAISTVLPEPETEPGGNPSFRYEREGSLVRIEQPPWRKPGKLTSPLNLLLGIAFCLPFSAVGVYLFTQHQWVMGAIFFLVGTGFIAAMLGYVAHALVAEVRPDGIRVVRSLLGVRLKDVSLARHEIAAIEAAAEAGQVGSTLTRKVRVRGQDGKAHIIAEFIPGQREALALRDLVASRLALGAAGRVGNAAVAEEPGHAQEAGHEGSRKAGFWVEAVIGLITIAFIAEAFYPFVKDRLFPPEPPRVVQQPPAPQPQPQPRPTPAQPLPPADKWDVAIDRGARSMDEGRQDEARQLFAQAIELARRDHGADDPREALAHYRMADSLRRTNERDAQVKSLVRALEIVEARSVAETKRALDGRRPPLDKEIAARYLGDVLWDLRRYAEAHPYYVKGWNYALEVDVSEAQRNVRRAQGAAGVMKTACTLGKWDLADQAMAELKERYASADPEAQRGLKYWIDTGEPRLKSRKC